MPCFLKKASEILMQKSVELFRNLSVHHYQIALERVVHFDGSKQLNFFYFDDVLAANNSNSSFNILFLFPIDIH